jgi:5-methylcytosine-specific restriction endonuclease McrA
MERPAEAAFDNTYTERFRSLAQALASGDSAESRRLVEVIANPGSLNPTTRQVPSLRLWAAVFARDSYTCRYCERETIAPPVLRVVSRVYPELFRYHPHWKTSETDAAYFITSTSADHVVPVTRGGSDTAENLVTACWTCNSMKGNFLLSELRNWKRLPVADTLWRGLTEYLDAMIQTADLTRDVYLRQWADAVRNPERLDA